MLEKLPSEHCECKDREVRAQLLSQLHPESAAIETGLGEVPADEVPPLRVEPL